MKWSKFIIVLLSTLTFQSCICFGDCDFDDVRVRSAYNPILLDRNDFENSVSINEPKSIVNSGKIYVKDSFLFINEINEGFHIYDNSDPSQPKALKFINAPGSTDLAIRNQTLYINQATDLVAVNINTDTYTITVEKRIKNTFPEITPPDGFFDQSIPEEKVIIGWTEK